MKISLQYKLLAALVGLLACVLICVGIGGSILIRDYFLENKRQDLTSKAYELANLVTGYYSGQISYQQLRELADSIDSLLNARVWIVDRQLGLVAVSAEAISDTVNFHRQHIVKPSPLTPDTWRFAQHDHRQRHMAPTDHRQFKQPRRNWATQQPTVSVTSGQSLTPLALSDLKGMTELSEFVTVNSGQAWSVSYYHPYYEEKMLIAAVPITLTEGSVGGTVMLHVPLTEFERFLQRIYTYFGYAALVALLLAILVAAIMARSIVTPLAAMQKTAAAMACGDYEQRIKISTRDELGELGVSLNCLARDLGEYVRQLETVDTLRREFVANVSHELRTPLTILYGYNQALQDGTINSLEQVQQYRAVMAGEILRLEKLINDLLDLSQLQTAAAVVDGEPVLLSEIITNVTTLLQPQFKAKAVALDVMIEPMVPAVYGDGDRLIQLVLILLDNALKFTPTEGKVIVTLNSVLSGVELSISDTGVGIADDILPYIWERFYKIDKARRGGSGLGLAIAKQILDLHKADVNVSSRLGEGTEFLLKFASVNKS